MANIGLERTQRWLQSFIITPGSDEESLASTVVRAAFDGNVEQVVTPSKTLTSQERAAVYRDMYLLRLADALTSDYPVTRDWMGPKVFEQLVAGYVQEHPSRSYTLNRLGDHLPVYLAGRRELTNHEFLHALASFELAVTEVFDEEEVAALAPEQIAAVPDEKWETAKLGPIAALRLRKFDYRVDLFKECYRDSEPYPDPTPETTFIAVYRQSYRVFWMNLTEPEYDLLGSLVGGARLGEAIEKACIAHGLEADQLLIYFRDWMSKDLFSEVG